VDPAVLERPSSSDGATPLLRAAEGGSVAVCRVLLDSGDDLTARNVRDETALHVAFEFKREACAAFLLARGAKGCGDLPARTSRQQRCQKCALSRKMLERRLQRERLAEAKAVREVLRMASSSSSSSSSSAAAAAADWSEWSSQVLGGAAGETVAQQARPVVELGSLIVS
jgi:hypothetical protein